MHQQCVYPSNFAIDTFLYNLHIQKETHGRSVYILQILQLIHSYTTLVRIKLLTSQVCISFKFCN